jgi:hypothetical protein
MCQYIGISCINKLESLFENSGCEDAVVLLANIHICTSTESFYSYYTGVPIVHTYFGYVQYNLSGRDLLLY